MKKCSTVIISCIDFRFQNHIQKLIKLLSIENDVDIINIVGGAISLDDYKKNGKTMLDVSIELHNPKNIILTGHDNCGAGTTCKELKKKLFEYKKRYHNHNVFIKWFN